MMARPVARDAAATGARERWEGVGVRTPTPLPWGRSPVDTGAPPASAGGMATRRRIAPAPGNSTCLRLGRPRLLPPQHPRPEGPAVDRDAPGRTDARLVSLHDPD